MPTQMVPIEGIVTSAMFTEPQKMNELFTLVAAENNGGNRGGKKKKYKLLISVLRLAIEIGNRVRARAFACEAIA